jgi:hypothetical protein
MLKVLGKGYDKSRKLIQDWAWWLTPIILALQEAEIRRTKV